MKKFIVIEVVVIIALVIGFLVGKSLNSDDFINYYRNADRAWQEAVKTDIPPVTLDDFDQKRLQQVRALYREVFDKYPNSDWADDLKKNNSLFLGVLLTIIRTVNGQMIRFMVLLLPIIDWGLRHRKIIRNCRMRVILIMIDRLLFSIRSFGIILGVYWLTKHYLIALCATTAKKCWSQHLNNSVL